MAFSEWVKTTPNAVLWVLVILTMPLSFIFVAYYKQRKAREEME